MLAMNEALLEAKKAYALGEIPVGAVLVQFGRIIVRGHNECEKRNSPLFHAEMMVLHTGLEILKSYYLDQCDLYVTLEPCALCASAILKLRIRTLVFGAYSPKTGQVDHHSRLFDHQPIDVIGGIGERGSASLLKRFFEERRKNSRGVYDLKKVSQ